MRGDICLKNRHVGVNFDDRDLPAKKLPAAPLKQGHQGKPLQSVVHALQRKNVRYNQEYYSQVKRRDLRALPDANLEDPRSLAEVEQENVALKEQFLHSLLTLESYYNVALLWHEE